MARQEAVTLSGPAGDLEGLLETPDEARAVGVVCHPHPLYQGTMLNKVAHTLARAMHDVDTAVLRFNFRGVGNSAGEHDHGVGETEDALAAARWVRGRYPGLPLVLAGFSFGGRVALATARRADCNALITVAPAVGPEGLAPKTQPQMPWLIAQGGADDVVACDDVLAFVNTLAPGPELVVFDDVGHFFHGQLTPLRHQVVAFLRAAAQTGGDEEQQ